MRKVQIWMFQKIFRFQLFGFPHTDEKNADFFICFEKIYVGPPCLWYLNLSDSDLGPFIDKSLKC